MRVFPGTPMELAVEYAPQGFQELMKRVTIPAKARNTSDRLEVFGSKRVVIICCSFLFHE